MFGHKLFAIGLAALALSGCATAPPPPTVDLSAEEKLIRDDEANWNKDWASKDVEKIASHYAADATVMTPGGPAMKGVDGIKSGLKSFVTDPNVALSFSSQKVEIAKAGDMAVAQGTYSMTMSDPKTKKPITEKGNFVTTYKKQADGSWKAVEDINTPDGTH